MKWQDLKKIKNRKDWKYIRHVCIKIYDIFYEYHIFFIKIYDILYIHTKLFLRNKNSKQKVNIFFRSIPQIQFTVKLYKSCYCSYNLYCLMWTNINNKRNSCPSLFNIKQVLLKIQTRRPKCGIFKLGRITNSDPMAIILITLPLQAWSNLLPNAAMPSESQAASYRSNRKFWLNRVSFGLNLG